MEAIRKQRQGKREYQEYLASGSSKRQLDDTIRAIESANLSDNERQYTTIEVIPMLNTLFMASVRSSNRHLSWTQSAKYLGLAIAIMSMISSTQAVSMDDKWIPLLVAGIVGVNRELLYDMIRTRQPALDWFSARESFDSALGEVVNWLSQSDVYSLIPDQNDRFLEFSRRVNLANGNNERRIQQQLRTLLETQIMENELEEET